MIKNILFALDGSEHSKTALRYALWLASQFRAHLSGLPMDQKHVADEVVAIEEETADLQEAKALLESLSSAERATAS